MLRGARPQRSAGLRSLISRSTVMSRVPLPCTPHCHAQYSITGTLFRNPMRKRKWRKLQKSRARNPE